ncbi:MAG TPA: hypothetical protein VEP89_09000, partial [Draconibacterium sp.]|nr:hypothetical protein [Draconibacterium sp.]
MKTLFSIFFLLLVITSSGQLKKFLLEGQVVDQENNPISDVYVVNTDNHTADISRENGEFSMMVSHGDTLVLSHISYFRKMVSGYALLINPKVEMISQDVDIPEIVVSPNQPTNAERAGENIHQIDWDRRPLPEDNFTESERLEQAAIANNRVRRSEAAYLSIFEFSPS